MDFGLTQATLDRIVMVFSGMHRVDRVLIFGSRALGRHKEGSDIDLAIFGRDLNLNDILQALVKLEDLNLPYRFDLVNMAQPVEADLVEHISRVGITIFERSAQSV